MPARMCSGPKSYRIRILDIGLGGLLLAPIDGYEPVVGETIQIQAVLIGRLDVAIVALSPLGIHVRIQEATPDYEHSVRRISALITTWDAGL